MFKFSYETVPSKLNADTRDDLHDKGFPPSIEVLVESMATPILLLSLLEHFPVLIRFVF